MREGYNKHKHSLLTVRKPLPLLVILQVWALQRAAVVYSRLGMLQGCDQLSVLVLACVSLCERVQERYRRV